MEKSLREMGVPLNNERFGEMSKQLIWGRMRRFESPVLCNTLTAKVPFSSDGKSNRMYLSLVTGEVQVYL